MLSSWPIWEFFKTYPADSWNQLTDKAAMVGFDELSVKLIKNHIVGEALSGLRPKTLWGTEITFEWFEEEFCQLSFFMDQTDYIVLMPDQMNSKIKELILSPDFKLQNKKLVLAFEKESAFQKKWSALPDVETLKLEAPKFWETQKLLDFCTSHLKLPLTHDAKTVILESIEPTLVELYRQCEQIKIMFPSEKNVTLEMVQQVVVGHFIDRFKLATEFGKKRFASFFGKIAQDKYDFETLRELFFFMQTHLIKFLDTGYLNNKPRLSQYDKEIQNLSKIWTKEELITSIQFFSSLEMECKKKNFMLYQNLRRHFTYAQGPWLKMIAAAEKV